MNGNDFARLFSAVFSKVGLFTLWATFLAGTILRWVAYARVKAQVTFLNAYDRALLGLKGTQALSQSQLREKSETLFRNHYPSKGGKKWLQLVDRILGGEASSWQIIDRVVNLAFDKRGGSAQERSRYVLSSIDSMTHFFKIFSLGAFHRIGAATPALLILLGAMGTYTGFLTALPGLTPSDIADPIALQKVIGAVLARMSVHTGFTLLGTLLAAAAVTVNAIWDAERTFQSATNRLAHIVEFLGLIERSETAAGLSEAAEANANAGRGRTKARAATPAPVENHFETPVAESPHVAEANVPEYSEETTAIPAAEKPMTRRPRAEVVKAEKDWGPLPLSAVPSPKKKPIRVEAAEAPKFEEAPVSDDDQVAAQLSPEISAPLRDTPRAAAPVQAPAQSQATSARAPHVPQFEAPAPQSRPPRAAVSVPVPIAVPDPWPPFEDEIPMTPVPEKFPGQGDLNNDFQFPETALPADWDAQIRGLKNQLSAMETNHPEMPTSPAIPEAPAPEMPMETPYDEQLEKTIVGTPQLVAQPSAPRAAHVSHDSPTEAELIAMMVPKEWATQRPADQMPHGIPEDFEAPMIPAPVARTELRSVPTAVAAPAAATHHQSVAQVAHTAHTTQTAHAAPAPHAVAQAPAPTHAPAPVTKAPAAPVLSAADQDRLAILNHRMDKVQLYLSKAAEDLKEGIISQEMFDDESNRWRHEVDVLSKELNSFAARKAA